MIYTLLYNMLFSVTKRFMMSKTLQVKKNRIEMPKLIPSWDEH